MSIRDSLAAAKPEGQVNSAGLPSGWQPSVTYQPNGSAEVVTLGVGQPSEDDWKSEVEALGVAIPEGFTVRLVQVSHDPAAWVRYGQGEDAVTQAVTRRRWAVEPARPKADIDELLSAIGKRRPQPPSTDVDNGWAAVLALADWQIGKVAFGEGSDQTIQRIFDALDKFIAGVKRERKKRPISTILLPLLGDMCEGQVSQGGAVLVSSDLTMTEQIRIVRRVLLEHVKALAPLTERLVIPTAPGNHDEPNRILGGKPRGDDSFLVDVACQIGDALDLAGGYDHVEIVTPDIDDLTVTVEVAGTIVGCAHGHQIKRGQAHAWWAKQGHARHRIGAASLLLTGHYHHLRVEQDGERWWMQAPTTDPGSPWFQQKYGGGGSGTLTFYTRNNEWNGLEIL